MSDSGASLLENGNSPLTSLVDLLTSAIVTIAVVIRKRTNKITMLIVRLSRAYL